MFLINSRYPLFCATGSNLVLTPPRGGKEKRLDRSSLFRSYGVNLPSSFNMVLFTPLFFQQAHQCRSGYGFFRGVFSWNCSKGEGRSNTPFLVTHLVPFLKGTGEEPVRHSNSGGLKSSREERISFTNPHPLQSPSGEFTPLPIKVHFRSPFRGRLTPHRYTSVETLKLSAIMNFT